MAPGTKRLCHLLTGQLEQLEGVIARHDSHAQHMHNDCLCKTPPWNLGRSMKPLNLEQQRHLQALAVQSGTPTDMT